MRLKNFTISDVMEFYGQEIRSRSKYSSGEGAGGEDGWFVP